LRLRARRRKKATRTLSARSRHAAAPSWASLCLFLAAASARAGEQAVAPPAAANGVQAPSASAVAAPEAPAREEVVAAVRILRNRFIPQDTLLYYVSTKAGDRYDETRLRQDFSRLWETGFLDDLLLDVEDSAKGKIVSFVVEERRRIQIVDYRGSKALSNTAIEDELKKRELSLRIDSFFDEAKARRVDAMIKGMLDEKGRPFGSVKHETKPVGGGSGVQVSFIIDDGDHVRVREVDFVGNKVFSSDQLRGAMKKVKRASFWNFTWLTGKSTYTDDKWSDPQEGDQRNVEDYLLDHGYVTATVGQPKITHFDGYTRNFPFFKKKAVRWTKLEVPVTEGEQYRVGKVEFAGLTVFKEDAIRSLFKLQSGEVYRESRIKKGYEKLRDAYGYQGYFQWQPLTQRKPDPEKKVVDVVLTMQEDKRYYVGRIVFLGNDMTKDKVIRREVYLNEGDVFNTDALKQSIRRINQLGYFKPMEQPPEVAPSVGSDDHLDVSFKVEEQNRNQFTFGAGVSGLEGTFVNASFQTSNFLGAGETLSLSAQSGARTKNYSFSATEPYLFDRPITAGFNLYKRNIEYQTTDLAQEKIQGYTDDRTGIGLTTGLPAGRFSRFFLGYTYEVVKISIGDLTADEQSVLNTTGQIVNRFFLEDAGTRHLSQLTPSFVYNTVDNPYTPRSGKKVTLSFGAAGGPLGGTENILKPSLEGILYLKQSKVTSFGFRVNAGWVLPFGATEKIDPATGHSALPFYERFLLGGENQIRGFDVRTIGPIANGLPTANKFLLGNAEYYFDVIGPLRMLLFFDAGQAYAEGSPMVLKGFSTSTGVEARFIMPVLNVPFRLIYAYNPNRPVNFPKGGFKFAVGSTF
jgi:outer membrane protein insertion porin family